MYGFHTSSSEPRLLVSSNGPVHHSALSMRCCCGMRTAVSPHTHESMRCSERSGSLQRSKSSVCATSMIPLTTPIIYDSTASMPCEMVSYGMLCKRSPASRTNVATSLLSSLESMPISRMRSAMLADIHAPTCVPSPEFADMRSCTRLLPRRTRTGCSESMTFWKIMKTSLLRHVTVRCAAMAA